MVDERPGPGLKHTLNDIVDSCPRDEAVFRIEGMLREEYSRLEAVVKRERESYLSMNVDDPSQQNDVADLRLSAVESYQPAYEIEKFLANMDVDIMPLLPAYEGRFEPSSFSDGQWMLSMVSLKENAMRTLGGHCNIIGDVIVLERLLYDHTYLAAVMKLTDDYEPGKDSFVEFDFYTVVFDEDIQALVKVPYAHL